MFCTKCGSEIKDGNDFCQSCGAPVKAKQVPKEKKTIKTKNKALLIVLSSIIAVSVIIFAVIMQFLSRPGTKFLRALDKTINLKSLNCSIDVENDNATVEAYEDGEQSQFSLEFDNNRAFAYADGKLVETDSYNDPNEIKDKSYVKLADCISKRDIKGICEILSKDDKFTDEVEIADDCNLVYERAIKILEENMNNYEESNFIRDFEENDDTYTMEIDLKRLLKTIYNDSEIQFKRSFKSQLRDVINNNLDNLEINIEYTIKHGYITNSYCEVSRKGYDNKDYVEIDINDNKINPKNSIAMEIVKDCEDWKRD